MAFKFNAILKFNGEGVKKQLGKAQRGFKAMSNSISKANQNIGKLGQGIKGLTLAGAPLAAGVAIATKEFADFEKQMSVVRSLTGDITKKEFASMTAEAKRLGATTSFTAKEAAQGFEFLALAGFNVEDQIGSLESVLNLAAAGSLELGSASDIVTDSMGSLAPALDKHASKVENITSLVDKMAFIQSKTNTNVTQLGDAIKFGGGAMAAAKVPLDSILVAMGGLANAGLKGSIGGTALTNAFTKMAKPSTKAIAKFEELGIQLRDSNDNFLPMPQLMANITKGMNKVEGGAEKMAVAQELFGLRGQRAIFALMNEGTASLTLLQEGMKDSTGTAAKQAKTRLDNLAGSFTIMQSAVSGVLIEVGGLFGSFLTKPIRKAAAIVSNFAIGFQIVTGQIDRASKGGKGFFDQFGKEKGEAILGFIEGFIDGFKEASEFLVSTGKQIAAFFGTFIGDSDTSAKSIGKLVAQIITIGAIAAPILAAVVAGFFVLGPILTGISGAAGLVGQAFGLAFTLFKTNFSVMSKLFGFLNQFKPALGFLKIGLGKILFPLGMLVSVVSKVISRWDILKQAFSEGFGTGLLEVIKTVGLGILDFFLMPLKLVFNIVDSIVNALTGISISKLGGKLLDTVGAITGFFGGGDDEKNKAKGAPNINKISAAAAESTKIQKESVSQKALVQPASAEQTAKAISVQGGSAGGGGGASGGGGSSTTKVVLELHGDAGKLLNKKVTEDQINNAFEQGKDVKNKFRARSNGAVFAN